MNLNKGGNHMSSPREDANCTNCYVRNICGKFNHKEYDLITGKPYVDCYGYAKEMTEEDVKISTWSNKN